LTSQMIYYRNTLNFHVSYFDMNKYIKSKHNLYIYENIK
jgi:hypothetical protein